VNEGNVSIYDHWVCTLRQEYTVYCSPRDSFMAMDTMEDVNAA